MRMGRVSANIIVRSLCGSHSGCKRIHAIVNLFTAAMNNISRDPQVSGTRGSIQVDSSLYLLEVSWKDLGWGKIKIFGRPCTLWQAYIEVSLVPMLLYEATQKSESLPNTMHVSVCSQQQDSISLADWAVCCFPPDTLWTHPASFPDLPQLIIVSTQWSGNKAQTNLTHLILSPYNLLWWIIFLLF